MKPSLALRLTKPHLLQPVLSGSNVTPPWYLAGGIPAENCLRAYQPMLADDLADSYINLVNPGTGNIVQVGAPGWDLANGWTGNGTSSSLRTGLTGASGYKSVAIRFSNAAAGALKALFATADSFEFYCMPNNTWSGDFFSAGFENEQADAGGRTEGIVIFTGQKIYFDGEDIGLTYNVFTPPAGEVYLLSMAASYYGNMSIQAAAFYDIDITPYVTQLNSAMGAIGELFQMIQVEAADLEDTLEATEEACSDTGTFIRADVLSRVLFSTKAQLMSMILYSDAYTNWPTMAEVGVRVDGVDVAIKTVSANGSSSGHAVALPGGYGVTKIVEVINGVQGRGSGVIKGTWLKAAGFDKTASVYHPAVTQEMDRVIFVGDSITEGGNADDPPLEAAVQLVRAAYDGKVLVNAYGSRALEDIGDHEAFAELVVTWEPSIIWIALGTNDYGLNQGSAAVFATRYADLLDELHAEMPDATIYCQTPLTRGTETANTSGSTMADFRTAISNAVTARSGYCILVDGTAILTYPDDYSGDELHPSTAGQAVYGQAILAELGMS